LDKEHWPEWVLRFVNNSLYKKRGLKEKGPVDTGGIEAAKKYWIRRVRRNVPDGTEVLGWRLVKHEDTGILKCEGRITGYRPIYLNAGQFVEKLIAYTHEKIMHLDLGMANCHNCDRK
jgi:hypothetical protein